jgi:poly(hydroxyalkanoate) granule-associated protein
MLRTVTAITHQVRLAGIGALSKAQQIGNEVLESLIKEGAKVEGRDNPPLLTKKPSTSQLTPVTAGDELADLEQIFQDRVARALKQLDIPNQDDLRLINQKVETLHKNIQKIAQQHKTEEV